jgi:hypothetical protein
MAQEDDEVLKEFVRRVNALLDRLQKAAGLGGPMNQADPRKTSGVTLDLGRSTIFRATLPTPSA